MISIILLLTLFSTILLSIFIGWYSTHKVKNYNDFFMGGQKAGALTVTGILTGTIIGGSTTIGTAQLGFHYGLSGFWFTIVMGIAIFSLGLMAKWLKKLPYQTVTQILGQVYGKKIIPWASICIILGMSINTSVNLLAARSLLATLVPLSLTILTILAGLITVFFIVLGGIWSGSWIGLFKTSIIYILIILSSSFVVYQMGGFAGVKVMANAGGGMSLFGRGVGHELAGGISILIGVLSTQTYYQAIFAGKDVKKASQGAYLAALLVVPVGLAGFLIGSYMRMYHPYIDSAQALPLFVLNYFPGWLAGIMIGGLLLSVLGGAAGLTLGISTLISNDFYIRLIKPKASEKEKLLVSRGIIVAVISLIVLFLLSNPQMLMNELTYLSMGLRGAAIFLPLMLAIFYKERVSTSMGFTLLFTGLTVVILWTFFGVKSIDPVYPALAVNIGFLVVRELYYKLKNLVIKKPSYEKRL